MFELDNCRYCIGVTPAHYKKLKDLLLAIESGEVCCWLCAEEGRKRHTEFDVIDRYGKKIWCGHTPKCPDLEVERKKVINYKLLSKKLALRGI